MAQLLKKLTFSREQKKMPVDDDSVLYALQVFLSSVKDGWVLGNFSVAVLNSKYNEITSNARKTDGTKRNTTNIYERKRADSERRKLEHLAKFAEIDRKFLERQAALQKVAGTVEEVPGPVNDGS